MWAAAVIFAEGKQMSNILSVVKTAAKRLKKSIPDKSLMQIHDIATHAITGKSSFHELQKTHKIISHFNDSMNDSMSSTKGKERIEKVERLKRQTWGEGYTPESWGERHKLKSILNRGNWHFYQEQQAIVLEDVDYVPYVVYLSDLDTTAKLLDFILHIQQKRHHDSNDWYDATPAFEIDNFITLINDLCNHYFKKSVQGMFSPHGSSRVVSWANALEENKFSRSKEGE